MLEGWHNGQMEVWQLSYGGNSTKTLKKWLNVSVSSTLSSISFLPLSLISSLKDFTSLFLSTTFHSLSLSLFKKICFIYYWQIPVTIKNPSPLNLSFFLKMSNFCWVLCVKRSYEIPLVKRNQMVSFHRMAFKKKDFLLNPGKGKGNHSNSDTECH